MFYSSFFPSVIRYIIKIKDVDKSFTYTLQLIFQKKLQYTYVYIFYICNSTIFIKIFTLNY